MARFKVTLIERCMEYRTKVFEASNEDEARTLAEEDDSWTDLDGWEDDGSTAGECGIETVEELK